MKILKLFTILMLVSSLCFGAASRDFDGVDDRIRLDSAPVTARPFTVLGWIKTDDGEGFLNSICVQTDDNNWYRSGLSASKMYADKNGGGFNTLTGVATLTNGVWYFVAYVWISDGVNGSVFYLNGVLDKEGQMAGDGTGFNRTSVGNLDRPTATGFFNGQISNSLLYNRSLSINEINQLMWLPDSIPSGLQIYWPIWGTASPEQELSGNGRTGTLTGTTADVAGPSIMFGGGLPL